MANHIITLAPGNRGFALPNGVVITDAEEVVVTEEVFEQVSSWFTSGLLVDGGTTTDAPTEPEVPNRGGSPAPAPGGGTTDLTEIIEDIERLDEAQTLLAQEITGKAPASELSSLQATVAGLAGGGGGPEDPSPFDDEFDGTSSAPWVNTPTAAAANEISSSPGMLHLRAAGSGNNLVGRLQPAPTEFPYTIQTKIVSTTARGNYHRGGGIMLANALGGFSYIVYAGIVFNANNNGNWGAQAFDSTMNGGSNNQSATTPITPKDLHVRVTVNSANSVTISMSNDGKAWWPVMTNWGVGPFAYIGLAISEESAHVGVDAYFDHFRVTV